MNVRDIFLRTTPKERDVELGNTNKGPSDRLIKKENYMRSKKIKNHCNALIENGTLHGMHYCFDKKHPLRRICWTLLLLAAFGLVGEKLYDCVKRFFDRPFNTKTTIKYVDKMTFPAISLCNLNDMRSSVMNGTLLDRILILGDSNFTKYGLSGKEYQSTIRDATHTLDDMLVDCIFKKKERCSVKDFKEFNHNQGDRCFTFNSGDDGLIRYVNNTGTKNALELTLNVQHYDYHRDTDKSGVHLIIHGQGETPVKMQGVILSPGFVVYGDVKKRTVKNLPKPYKTDCGMKSLKYFKTYSRHTCWLESLTDHVVEKCGCRDWFMPGKHKVCPSFEEMKCMWSEWEKFEKLKEYSCPLPCLIDTYTPSLSFGQFPSNPVADKMAKDLNLTGSALENRLLIRDNYLKIVIFYNDLSYEYMEQVPSYDMMVLLGDIGGQLGLFLGSSALTYFEFLDCLVMVIYAKFFQKFQKRPHI